MQRGVLVKRFPVEQNKTKKNLPLLTLSLCSTLTSSATRFISNINTASFPSSPPHLSVLFCLSALYRRCLACSAASLIGAISVGAQTLPSLAAFVPRSRQHMSQRFPLPHAGFKCVCAFSFHPSLCFITTSTNSATEAREEAEWGASGMIRGERRQSRRVGLDGWRLYKAGSEDWNVCGGCSSNIELRLFLDTAGATWALSTSLY